MKELTLISAFLGGAIVGCAAAFVFAPEKGEDVRARIVSLFKKHGCKISDEEVDAFVAELAESNK